MKAIIILMILLGLLMYALIVATATPNDRHEYEMYMRWKKRKYNSRYKHGAMCDTEDAWKEMWKHDKRNV